MSCLGGCVAARALLAELVSGGSQSRGEPGVQGQSQALLVVVLGLGRGLVTGGKRYRDGCRESESDEESGGRYAGVVQGRPV